MFLIFFVLYKNAALMPMVVDCYVFITSKEKNNQSAVLWAV